MRLAGIGVIVLAACGGDGSPVIDAPADPVDAPDTADAPELDGPAAGVDCAAFLVTGDPTADRGAPWTYESTDDGVDYRLSGVLLAPAGAGPFPAVVVSHGRMGSATDYGARAGDRLRDLGLVAIATNYTHGSVTGLLPDGPGDDFGSSPANIQRAYKARQLLGCVALADATRVAAHGHSMGAFVTGGLLGTHPGAFVAASHTAGGVADAPGMTLAATSSALARQITTPYQLHHGTHDCTVVYATGQRLDTILTEVGTAHEFHPYEYPGTCTCPSDPGVCADHMLIADDTTMWDRVRAWYAAHGLL